MITVPHVEFLPDPLGSDLYRILAVKHLTDYNVAAGTWGGLVWGPDAVQDEAWVDSASSVRDSAVVSGNALVSKGSILFGEAEVGERATVERGIVRGKARVLGCASLSNGAVARADSVVSEVATVSGPFELGEGTRIMGSSSVACSDKTELLHAQITRTSHFMGSSTLIVPGSWTPIPASLYHIGDGDHRVQLGDWWSGTLDEMEEMLSRNNTGGPIWGDDGSRLQVEAWGLTARIRLSSWNDED